MPILLTVADVCDALRLSESRVYELLADGSIASVKIGRSRRIPAEALTSYIDGLKGAR